MVLQLLINGMISGCAYALVALGFAFIYNTTRVFHFAHGAVYTISAYVFYTFNNLLGLPLFVSIVFTIVLAAVSGILIEEFIYYPLRKQGASLFMYLLSSIGLYIVAVNSIALIFQSDTKVLSPSLQPTYSVGILILTRFQVATVSTFLGLFTSIFILLKKTDLGKVIRAMRDNPDLVSAMGINPQNVRRAVYGLGSGLAAFSAILLGLDVGIDPHIGLVAFLSGAVAVIIGGVGIFEGATLGAFFLGLLQSLAVWRISARWQELITFFVLISFLLFRPEGILGKRRRTEEAKI